ncbi:MAG: NADH-quinone oxidoreductase subunit N [Bacteroidia bacterium]|nr:NADH-quinone oxidoreductase subunit N [Bacteroidia bacterium]
MNNYMGILSAGWLIIGGALVLIAGTFQKVRRRIPELSIAIGGGATLLNGLLAWFYPLPKSGFFGMVWGGGIYSFLAAGVMLAITVGLSFLWRSHREGGYRGWEAFPLTLFIGAALSTLPASNHLLLSVVALETVSLGAYVLTGLSWENRYAPEAAVKYFLLGAVGFAFLLLGISYLYGLTGTLYLHHLWPMRWTAWHGNSLFALAMVLIAIGILFKLSIFPFHWWAPDVYGGATPSSAGLVVALGKLNAAFLAGVFLHYIHIPSDWLMGLASIAAISSLYGNLGALGQTSIQRMLGYSSIAHGSYILLGLVSGPEGRLQAWGYTLVYALTSTLTFGLLSLRAEPMEYKSLRGLGYNQPGYALAVAICLASLSGMPPLIGFFAKYGIFTAAFRAGYWLPSIVALIGALIGYFYYWRPIAWMYQAGEEIPIRMPALALSTGVLVGLGLLPMALWGWLDYLYGLAGLFLPRP